MSNPLSRFFNDRFIQPAVEKALTSHDPTPPAYGISHTADISLKDAVGQPHDADYALLYSLYKLNTDVSAAVNKWVGGVTGPGWRITTMTPDIKMTDALRREAEEVERWLRNPNPYKLFALMLQEGVQHHGIVGNFYWHVTEDRKGRPLEIWPMHPALTKVVATDVGERLGYVMQPPGGTPVHFEPDEVLDFPLPNPTNDLYGESPLERVVEEAGIDLVALRSNKSLLQNGAKPSAVVLMDDTANKEHTEQMVAMLKQSHTGAANQHKIMALSKTRDFKPWTMSNRDMEYLGLRDLATEKVARAYLLPLVLLGKHKAGDHETTKFLIRDTYDHVYKPMQDVISSIITERLIHRFNPELRFELIKPSASDPDDLRKDQMQAKQYGILTSDEVRDQSFDKGPLEAEIANQEQAPTPKEQAPDQDAAISAEEAPEVSKSLTKAQSLQNLADRRAEQIDTLAEPLVAPIDNYFDMQEAAYIEQMPDSLTTEQLDDYLSAQDTTHDTVLTGLLIALLLPTLKAGTSAAQLQVGITLAFEQTNPLIQDYLRTQAATHVTGINQTTKQRLRSTLLAGMENHETLEQLTARVSDTFKEFKGYRSELIARNEVIDAYAYANHQSLQLMFEQGVISHRQWLTAQDDRVRPLHAELHGYTIRFDAKFPDEIEPGDEINCRCTEIGLTPEHAREAIA